MKWRVLFRSDSLHALTGADVDRLGALGVSAVYDLRTVGEREVAPDVPLPVSPVAFPLPQPSASPAAAIDGTAFLTGYYDELLDRGASTISALVRTIAQGSLPAVVHCTAGKDRTGVVTALMLLLLGVTLDDIVHDYSLTEQLRSAQHRAESRARLAAMGFPTEVAEVVLGSPADPMRAALARLATGHGSIERLALERFGISTEELQLLRDRFLEER